MNGVQLLLPQFAFTTAQYGVPIVIFLELEALPQALETVTLSTPEVAVIEKLAVIELVPCPLTILTPLPE
jgi:hypothetical protein